MRRFSGFHRRFALVLFCCAALAGCSGEKDKSGGGSAASGTVQPGTISGRITRPDGSPIGIAGAHFQVNIGGIAGVGNNVNYTPQVDANGAFSTPVASGIYHQATASILLPFNGAMYSYQLTPTKMMGDMRSDSGIVANFAWQVSGPNWMYKDNPDPSNFTNWYGGSCTLQWDNIYKAANGSLQQFQIPVGAVFDFTATAVGKCIDGSDPKPRSWQCKWVALGMTPTVLNDMPATAGGWHITGKETDPDGKTFPLGLERVATDQTYQPAVTVQFNPGQTATGGFWPVQLMVTRLQH